MHTISSYHGNRPTNNHTKRGDYNTLHRSLVRSVIKKRNIKTRHKQEQEFLTATDNIKGLAMLSTFQVYKSVDNRRER